MRAIKFAWSAWLASQTTFLPDGTFDCHELVAATVDCTVFEAHARATTSSLDGAK